MHMIDGCGACLMKYRLAETCRRFRVGIDRLNDYDIREVLRGVSFYDRYIGSAIEVCGGASKENPVFI